MLWKRNHFSKRFLDTHLDPDEVLLDAFNLPSFDVNQFEGRVERSIRGRVPFLVGVVATVVFFIFLFQAWNLQVARGEAMTLLSQQNRLDHEIIFAERGVILDRFGRELAWNTREESGGEENTVETHEVYASRSYTVRKGFAHLLGFVGYPEKDAHGVWWRTDYLGKAGVEKSYDAILKGVNGTRIIEVDALSSVHSSNIIRGPQEGADITLSIDADMQEQLYNSLRNGAIDSGFVAGAGIIMDVQTGEILAITNYPEYSSQVMSDGTDRDAIARYSQQSNQPFLNRALLGEYTPGSIVKPYIAAAALQEKIITPVTSILSTGEIRIPNPYSPNNDSVFRDWKVHGWVNVTQAIAVSSNVFFYAIGGGFEDQVGLGIEQLANYAYHFGLGEKTGIIADSEALGVVPTPVWKEEVFGPGDPWRLGNTYHTSIGQFGFLMTPIQAVRYISSIANGGSLLTPHIIKGEEPQTRSVGVADEYLQTVRNGMRAGAEGGTAAAVNVPGIRIAGKTGTAQLGYNNEYMNSWVIGFWPADEPRFAFATVLEKAPAGTARGAAPAMRSFFEWLVIERPEYVVGEYPESLFHLE